ncbi:acetylornithine deacetylase (ArgE) [Snodgrassella communis]|uniref:Acetylornithine deacetylase n=1 Tax=Snodgrassella communis TaxID=2946699 RepID=A0A837AH37_9NEIS|nr:acetylornithine deacetylase [Snodgrassella communis]KDN14858.1 Acetylornithine deacetylase [Snodgrassella communis]PIT08704.1 acetylornithine deacetylase (ArgE) [Snodgrassella communis]PIT29334.1 acetylornithine deacetylase (ArgE) [Snodgrassella communis]PIT29540.1 acetylornithine deacetylase (ArgE) [Snodgrassella communis]PIT35320.1 acetylornithine deacetylase (ArgE) [Snodgrassella communis]
MDTLDWLRQLIAFDTTSRQSNLALINHVASYLESRKLSPWLAYNVSGDKANLFVTIAASDGSTSGGLVFSGHTDVVPVDGQDWLSDPFVADVHDGCVYGRGSSDMKGFIASVLAAVPAMQAARLKRPLHIALSFDEEIGCLGAPIMLAELEKQGLQPQFCIVGEPTSMQMVVAHKGIHTFCCEVHGKNVHSSLTPNGVNAIEYAARLIVFINQLAQELQQRADLDHAFDVPFATVSTGLIRGGTAINIVPDYCTFEFDYRNLPHMTVEELIKPIEHYITTELLPTMQTVAPEATIKLTHNVQVPALNDANDQQLYALINQLVDTDQRAKVAYVTEGGQFQNSGISTVVCGPGSITVAHKANEYIELEQLNRCDHFLHKLIQAQSL